MCLSFWWGFFMTILVLQCRRLFVSLYMTMQHRLDRVLSLTTSLVTPLNFVMVGADSPCIKSFVDDDKNDISIDGPRLLRGRLDPVLHILFVRSVVMLGVAINEPFSETALLRDWARCFFKLANVVPACDWSILWVSVIYPQYDHIFTKFTTPTHTHIDFPIVFTMNLCMHLCVVFYLFWEMYSICIEVGICLFFVVYKKFGRWFRVMEKKRYKRKHIIQKSSIKF